MAGAEKSVGRGKDQGKRQQLKAVIASVFHPNPNGPDNGLLVSAAYNALVYCVQDVDRPLSPEDKRLQEHGLAV